jgi:hypothetical protein
VKRPPPKTRVPAERVRVIIHPPSEKPHDPPGYIGHHGGSFQKIHNPRLEPAAATLAANLRRLSDG